MLGILIFSAIAAYTMIGVGYAIDNVRKRGYSCSNKSEEDCIKISIEDMCSPNNKLTHFCKIGDSCSAFVSNDIIGKEEYVSADNLVNFKNKVDRLLRNYAAMEKKKDLEPVIF